ncbi:MAG: single-stranded DNA-binding protein [Clostridiales bacterium]|nr:single-stranded DNA-binding protein [Clostridiales bacterium]
MNKLTIIGNLTRDPETRTISTGSTVCSFTVAVNRRRSSQNSNQPEADFFRVSAWDKLGDNCQRFLAKGRKVAVVGPVSVSSYEPKDGTGTRFTLEVRAEDVEFLSSRQDEQAGGPAPAHATNSGAAPKDTGFTEVDDEDLPF